MFDITISYEDDTYIVRQEGEFIKDADDLYEALEFALAVGEANDQRVVVTSIKEN